MKKYVKPEIIIEILDSTEDIMLFSIEFVEEEDTLKGRVDIEDLI